MTPRGEPTGYTVVIALPWSTVRGRGLVEWKRLALTTATTSTRGRAASALRRRSLADRACPESPPTRPMIGAGDTGGVKARIYDALSRAADRKGFGDLRDRLVADVEGDVLEVGAGTGLNVSRYRRARRLVALEPDRRYRARLEER